MTDPASVQSLHVPLLDGAWLIFAKGWLDRPTADDLFARVHAETPWESREVILAGKRVLQPRQVAWMSEPAGLVYRYSGADNHSTHMTSAVREILLMIALWDARRRLSMDPATRPGPMLSNSVFLNLYRDEKDSIGFHADDEPCFAPESPIASVSLGAARRFKIQYRATRKTTELRLDHGDLLVMGGTFQKHYLHAIPKEGHRCGPRVNLTFRHFAI